MNDKPHSVEASQTTASHTAPISATYRSIYLLSNSYSGLPDPHTLTRKDVVILALRLANINEHIVHVTYFSKGKFCIDTEVYGIRIESDTQRGAIARARCAKYWRTSLERTVNLERINFEANNKLIGGPDKSQTEIYSSNATVERIREQTEASNLALSKMTVRNTITGEEFSMLAIASASSTNRFNELYAFTKNFEAIAKDNGMEWLFVTFTAPPEYHPNPSNASSKCSYNPELGVKASHLHISNAWQLIRSTLNKRGVKSSPVTYFGARTVEVHKDGCIHWHLLIFIQACLIDEFTVACKERFPLPGQLKIVLGDDKKGKASSYIFKYLMKEFNTNTLDHNITNRLTETDSLKDKEREDMDLASIENSERVRAAVRAMGIRQYQTIGLLRVTTLLRKINKLDLSDIADGEISVLGFIKAKVWRNHMGLKNLLEKPEIFRQEDDRNPSIRLIKESALSRYGEDRERVIGIEIDGRHFISKGMFEIIKKRQ